MAQNITMEVIEQLEVHRNGFSYSDVFNQNAREMLRFMRFVILMLTAQALESIPKSRRKEVEPGSFLDNFITMKFDEFLTHRGYRLVEILLFEDHRNFSNFLRVDFRKFAELRDSISDVQFNWGDGNIDPSTVFQENELGAGFVDNIYNYHIRDNNPAGGFMCLLEKRWILEILRDATLSLEQISDRLDKFYGYRPTALLWTLALMIRCGFIGSDLQDGVMRYFSERHGIYVVDVLSKKMAYIEHVFHHILLPLGILEDCSNCVKYQDLENWPYAAIVNCYVFVQYVRYVEELEKSGCGDKGRVKESVRILEDVKESVIRICEKDAYEKGERNRERWWSVRAAETIFAIGERWKRCNAEVARNAGEGKSS